MFVRGDNGNPYYVVGYLYRGNNGRVGIDPIEYGITEDRIRFPRRRFVSGPAYFSAIVENMHRSGAWLKKSP